LQEKGGRGARLRGGTILSGAESNWKRGISRDEVRGGGEGCRERRVKGEGTAIGLLKGLGDV